MMLFVCACVFLCLFPWRTRNGVFVSIEMVLGDFARTTVFRIASTLLRSNHPLDSGKRSRG